MKQLLKTAGVVLLVCAVVLYSIAGIIQEETKPQKVSFGVISNGQYIETGNGTMGGNRETVEEMNWLKAIGVLGGVAGTGMIAAGVLKKEETEYEY